MKLELKHLDVISFRDDCGEIQIVMVHSCQFPGWGSGALVYAVGSNGKEWLVPVQCVIEVNEVKLN